MFLTAGLSVLDVKYKSENMSFLQHKIYLRGCTKFLVLASYPSILEVPGSLGCTGRRPKNAELNIRDPSISDLRILGTPYGKKPSTTPVSVFLIMQSSFVFEPYWLMLSSGDFVIVQLFMVAGIYITKKINSLSTEEMMKKTQKRDLWAVILVFEFSAFLPLTYDVILQILGDDEIGCSGVFGHQQKVYSITFFIYMIFKFMLPIWTMLLVFHPTPSSPQDSLAVLGFGSEALTSSFIFNADTSGSQAYKRLHSPVPYDTPYDDPYTSRSFSIGGSVSSTPRSSQRIASAAIPQVIVNGPVGDTDLPPSEQEVDA
ncbi:unnamed protein product [Darwinula stevensoni]|uniref:Uncharacterized protein n=1 Tax=Darwinula stevensoni TaxID=69355 RepID=A0A7R9FRK4_9CRUS|nr:unnamed protein product [Darwinula stevensoni]CAG0901465.1 unnamed protein product [Darwinula stevensoni]